MRVYTINTGRSPWIGICVSFSKHKCHIALRTIALIMLYNYIRCTYLKEIFKNKINIVYSWVKSRRITKTSGYSICAGKQFHNQHFLVNNSTKALNVCWKKTTICTVCLPQGYSTHPIQNLNKKKEWKRISILSVFAAVRRTCGDKRDPSLCTLIGLGYDGVKKVYMQTCSLVCTKTNLFLQ